MAKAEKPVTFKVGDYVKWCSPGAGEWRIKRGQVVEVVKPGQYSRLGRTDAGEPRDHVSYIVRVPGLKASKRDMWPRVKYLEKVGK